MLESGKNNFFMKIASKKLLWFFVVLLVAILYGAIGYSKADIASAAVHSQDPIATVPVLNNLSRSTRLPICGPTILRKPGMPICRSTSIPESAVPTPTHTVKGGSTVTATPTGEKKPTPSPAHPTPVPTIEENNGPVTPPTKGFPSLPPTGSDPGEHMLP